MTTIPNDINSRTILEAARLYRDECGWTIHALNGPDEGSELERGKKPVETGWKRRKREDTTDSYLMKYFGNGKRRNLGLLVQPPHVVIDLDSKADAGASVRTWAAARPELEAWPCERTTGGLHMHVVCRDTPAAVIQAAGKGQKVEARLSEAVTCEIFLGGNVAITPSVHKSGATYRWERTGDIPEVRWADIARIFEIPAPEEEQNGRKGRHGDIAWAARFQGDLATLDIVALAQAVGLEPRVLDADEGKHAIPCPWASAHTTTADPRSDSSTVVFESRDGHWPGFKCLHTSHGEKSLADFLNWVEGHHPGAVDRHCARTVHWQAGQKADDGRPRVLLPCPNRPQSEFAQDTGKILGELTGTERLYMRNDVPVEVAELQQSTSFRTIGFLPLKPVRAITFVEKFAEVGSLTTGDFGRPVFVARSMNKQTAETLLSAPQFRGQLPRVDRILDVPQPVLRADGSIGYPKPGYDPEFHTYLNPDAPVIRVISLNDAIALLWQLFGEFCFADTQSIVHALAGLITPFCRGLLGQWNARTPIWLYKANRERAGKDYCANLTGILYEGHPNEDAPLGTDDAETRKKITSALLAGRRRLHFANCRGYINSAAIEMLATAPVWSERCLGENREATLPNEMDLSLSANTGITYTPDFANRCRPILMHYSAEDANARRFKCPNLHGWLLANRSLFVSALAALVNHWDWLGRPAGPSVFTSFPLWAKVVGGIMYAAGLGDPCLPYEEDHSVDGDRSTKDVKALFALARERFGDAWVRKDLIYELIQTAEADLFAWLDFDKKADRTKFGMMFHKYKGRVLGGIRLNVDETSGRSQRFTYQFEAVSEDGPGDNRDALFEGVFAGHLGHPGHPSNPGAKSAAPEKGMGEKSGEDDGKEKDGEKVAKVARVTNPVSVLITDRNQLDDIAAAISRAGQLVALDIKTYAGQKGSTDPWRGDIRLLSLCLPGTEPWLLDLKAIGYDLGPLADALQAATVLGHNLKFDALWLLVKCGIRLPTVLDTMTASRLLTAGTHEKNSLEAIVERHLGIQLDKAAQSAPWGGQLTPAHLRYAAADVANLHPLHDALTRELASAGLADVYRLEMELLPHVVDMEARGFPVDRDALQRHLDVALHDRDAAADRLRELFGSPHLNPASNPQLKAALAAKGIQVESTAEGALIEAKDQTYIPAILAYRGAAKRGSQAEGLLKAVQADGRIHARFEPMGTDTGRFSSRDPNLQNIERGAIRAAFAAPAGHSLVVADYSQIELRVAAAVAGETKMIDAYRQRTDLHRLTAAVVQEKRPEDVTKQDRQLAKAVNFGLLYGQSAPGLVRYAKASYDVDLTEDRARAIRNRFFAAYPKLKAWQDANGAAAAHATEARTVTGRRQLLTPGDEFRWSRFASSLNTPVQGGAADGIKRAIILIAQRLPQGCGLISTVHDELIALAPTDKAEEAKAMVETCMIEAMAELFPAVPVEVECAVCQNWSEK